MCVLFAWDKNGYICGCNLLKPKQQPTTDDEICDSCICDEYALVFSSTIRVHCKITDIQFKNAPAFLVNLKDFLPYTIIITLDDYMSQC